MKFQLVSTSLIALLSTSTVKAACHEPSPAFPPPTYHSADPLLLEAFSSVQDSLTSFMISPKYNTTSFSIQVTSTQLTLWSSYHTAKDRNSTRLGAKEIQGDSAYRIASITKTFTTLALLQLHKAGKVALDDPVTTYLPNLAGPLPWKDITLRTLASQLSGLPRDWSQGELLPRGVNPWDVGLPPPGKHSRDNLPKCYGYADDYHPCDAHDLYHAMYHLQPLFAPNAKSSYSNMAFEILGLVITNASGVPYEGYIQSHILDPINMISSSFTPPPDSIAALPKGNAWFWDVDEGVHKPTGGLYSTADDMTLFIRYILTHFNSLATGVNWLQPHSFSMGDGGESAYGMPWEIFRTTKLLQRSGRPVDFYTKSGGLPGYVSIIIIAPDYGLGFTVLVAGSQEAMGEVYGEIREKLTVEVIRAAEEIAARDMKLRYEGSYIFDESISTEVHAKKMNSSLALMYTHAEGLTITQFISNGTNVMEVFGQFEPELRDPGTRLQLVPTLLFADEKKQKGEKWRMTITPPRKKGVWASFCVNDLDLAMYDGNPLNELVMYTGLDGKVEEVELTAFRVRLKREAATKERLVVQEL